MTNPRFYSAGCVLLLLVFLTFCFSGSDANAPVEVAGVVYLDGQPLPNAEVFFVEAAEVLLQAESPQRAHGRTDETGRYELLSGVMPGAYRVVVRALVGGDQQSLVPGLGSDGVDIAQLEAASSAVEVAEQTARYGYRSRRRPSIATPKPLPPVYSSAEQTVLRIGVPENGTETADLQLSLHRVATGHRAHN